MITRTQDFAFAGSPCFKAVKSTWFITRIPIPCPEESNELEEGIVRSGLAFVRHHHTKEESLPVSNHVGVDEGQEEAWDNSTESDVLLIRVDDVESSVTAFIANDNGVNDEEVSDLYQFHATPSSTNSITSPDSTQGKPLGSTTPSTKSPADAAEFQNRIGKIKTAELPPRTTPDARLEDHQSQSSTEAPHLSSDVKIYASVTPIENLTASVAIQERRQTQSVDVTKEYTDLPLEPESACGPHHLCTEQAKAKPQTRNDWIQSQSDEAASPSSSPETDKHASQLLDKKSASTSITANAVQEEQEPLSNENSKTDKSLTPEPAHVMDLQQPHTEQVKPQRRSENDWIQHYGTDAYNNAGITKGMPPAGISDTINHLPIKTALELLITIGFLIVFAKRLTLLVRRKIGGTQQSRGIVKQEESNKPKNTTVSQAKGAKKSLHLSANADDSASNVIDTVIVLLAMAGEHSMSEEDVCSYEPDLCKRVLKDWSPLLPLRLASKYQRRSCHFLIRKLTRLSRIGIGTDRLLTFIEEWMTSTLKETMPKAPLKWDSMLRDLHLFLQTKYELPEAAALTLIPFLLVNASMVDICSETRLGKLVFSAEARLGDFYEEGGEFPPLSPRAKRVSADESEEDSTVALTPPPSCGRQKKPSMKLPAGPKEATKQQEKTARNDKSNFPLLLLDVGDVCEELNRTPIPTQSEASEASLETSLTGRKTSSLDGTPQRVPAMLQIDVVSSVHHYPQPKRPEKLPVYGCDRHFSPRSKAFFLHRRRYLESLKRMKQESKQKYVAC